MHRQHEHVRRRAQDDASTSHVQWDRYRDEKRRIEDMGLEPGEYTAMVREVAKELGI